MNLKRSAMKIRKCLYRFYEDYGMIIFEKEKRFTYEEAGYVEESQSYGAS